MATDNTTAPVEFPPLTESMSKSELAYHLNEVHGYFHHNGLKISAHGKVSKADMIEIHNAMHRTLDAVGTDPLVEVDERSGRVTHWENERRRYAKNMVRLPTVSHVHTAVAISEEDAAKVKAARSGGRITEGVLSASERRTLGQLVDNDFAMLRSEMEQFAADALKQRKQEINAEWESKTNAGPAIKRQADKLVDDAAAALRRLTDDAKEKGITLTVPSLTRYHSASFTIEGHQQALRDAEKENKDMLNRALMTLERQRLTAQRRVLLSGVTDESAKILDEIPDAKKLMVEAAKEGGTAISITS